MISKDGMRNAEGRGTVCSSRLPKGRNGHCNGSDVLLTVQVREAQHSKALKSSKRDTLSKAWGKAFGALCRRSLSREALKEASDFRVQGTGYRVQGTGRWTSFVLLKATLTS